MRDNTLCMRCGGKIQVGDSVVNVHKALGGHAFMTVLNSTSDYAHLTCPEKS